VERLVVLNPIGIFKPNRVAPAPRLKDLNNKKIGLHWNEKPRGDIALQRVKENLEERFTGVKIKFLPSTNIVRAISEEQFAEIMDWKPDAVIGATAD
jgi:hypothetical protein